MVGYVCSCKTITTKKLKKCLSGVWNKKNFKPPPEILLTGVLLTYEDALLIIFKNLFGINLSFKEFSFNFNFSLFAVLVMFYAIFYYIINFLAMQKLNDDIFDKLNE